MANVIVLIDQNGQLPITTKFDAEVDGPVGFLLTGTAYTKGAPTTIGIELILDGVTIGSAAALFANLNLNHQALRATFIPFDDMTVATHTLEIAPINANTVTDINDYFQVTMIY